MSQIGIKRANDTGTTLPVFEEIAKRFEAVRQRAFDLFESRGRAPGHDREDWLTAERELFCYPAAELAEKDGAYQLHISLAGLGDKDIEVTATPNEVVVHAARKDEKETQKGNVLWTEFGSSEVFRRFGLPNAINVDKVTASFENGVLRISAPQASKALAAAKTA